MPVTDSAQTGLLDVDSRNPETVRWVDYVLLAAPSFSTPMLVWAKNYVGVGHPVRLVLIGAIAWVVAALLLVALRRVRVTRPVSLVGVWSFVYIFMTGAGLVEALGYVFASLASVAVIFSLCFLLSRRPARVPRMLVILASVLLAVEVLVAWYSSSASLGDDNSQPSPPEIEVNLESTPDIILIVADAYVGLEGLERYFGVSEPPLTRALMDQGFTVPEVAFSSYVDTTAAIPAILEMAYPMTAGPGFTKATSRTLYERIGGENQAVRALASNGYEITMVESGWSGSICGDRIDTCIPSPFLNESTFFALNGTWLGPWVLAEYGYSFTVGALNTMSWLGDNLSEMTHDAKPDFVIAHLEIPHPPLFLDADCKLDTAPARSGVTLQWPGVDLDFRKEAYLQQAACLDGFVHRLSQRVNDESIVLMTGDHGTDSHHQLAIHPNDWSEDATKERLNVMFAYRGLGGCPIGEPVLLTNVLRDVFHCLGDSRILKQESRMFRYSALSYDGKPSPVVELSPSEVDRLLGQ